MDLPMREPGTLSIGGATFNEKTQAARQQIKAQLRRIRLAWRLVLVALLLTLAGIIWLGQTSAVVSLGYQIDNIHKQEVVLDRQAQVIEAQIATYESPAKIEQEAKTRLGMIYPDAKHIKYLHIPASSGQAGSDQAADTNPQLAQVSDWWRQLTGALPYPWQDSAPDRPASK